MIKEFILPDLGENITSADVLKVLVKPGDVVSVNDSVLEIETDKATIEVPVTIAGKVVEVFIKDGDKAAVGQVILKVEDSAEAAIIPEPKAAETLSADKEAPKESTVKNEVPAAPQGGTPKMVDFILPVLGENISAADVLKVLIKTGDFVEKDQSVIEIETDKATIEVPSTIAGRVIEVYVKEGGKAAVGEPVFKAEVTGGSAAKPADKLAAVAKTVVEENPQEFVPEQTEKHIPKVVERTLAIDNQPPIIANSAPAAPSVRRIARELGVDINKVPGSGKNNRISMDDVKAYVKALNEGRAQIAAPASSINAEPLPDFSKYGEFERKPMSNIRAKTAVHLSYAWNVIPHVTQFDKADITDLEKMRKSFAPSVEKAGGKLTVTAILLKVIASALKVYPQFNSSVDMQAKEVVYKKFYNIGVAVDTEHGLIVPVVKDVDKKNIVQISKDMNDVAEKARIRKISMEDLQGGCFTITNLGGIGGTYFTPIVNSPEVAILGVSRGSFEPIYKNGNFEPRLMLPLSLSYDHRIIDGADAVRFLRWIIEALEQPMKLLIEG